MKAAVDSSRKQHTSSRRRNQQIAVENITIKP
jgi:hypothetical protein